MFRSWIAKAWFRLLSQHDSGTCCRYVRARGSITLFLTSFSVRCDCITIHAHCATQLFIGWVTYLPPATFKLMFCVFTSFNLSHIYTAVTLKQRSSEIGIWHIMFILFIQISLTWPWPAYPRAKLNRICLSVCSSCNRLGTWRVYLVFWKRHIG